MSSAFLLVLGGLLAKIVYSIVEIKGPNPQGDCALYASGSVLEKGQSGSSSNVVSSTSKKLIH